MGQKREAASGPSAAAVAAESGDQDRASLEVFLQALGRAVRQLHTYPPSSPLCSDAVATCHHALAAVDRPGPLTFRVTPNALLLDDVPIGADTVIEHEVVRALTRARVATLRVDRAASVRDLTRSCVDLLSAADNHDVDFSDLLREHGVETIVADMAARAEVFDLGSPRPAVRTLVEHERQRHEPIAAGSRPFHLYPPGKGWVRLDPRTSLGPISLVDLAVLVEDPQEIATMLLRLTGDETAGTESKAGALERKFSDVAKLFAALQSDLSRLMFARLARAVLAMEPTRRRSLLQHTILPGLLDGRVDGIVLHDFPDPDLAESLCLLLDLETAAPDVLSAALDRLDLTPGRRQAVVPLLDAQLRARAGEVEHDGGASANAVDRYAERLLRVDASVRRSFSDLNAFDLSIDEQTTQALDHIRDQMLETDPGVARLCCLMNVIRLEPNPETVETLLARASALLGEMETSSRWEDVVSWLSVARQIAESVREQRPDVANAVEVALGAFCTRERALRVVEAAAAGGAGRELAGALVEACGTGAAPAWVDVLQETAGQPTERAIVQLLCEHAQTLAPALASRLADARDGVARAIIRVLGCAGPGYEAAIAGRFADGDEGAIREALRALARIGTAEAAALLTGQIEHPNPRVRAAAEESLWHLPPARLQAQVRALLGRRDFVLSQAGMAGRMIDRAARAGVEALDQTVAHLVPLRFRWWSPAVARVGRQAHRLVTK